MKRELPSLDVLWWGFDKGQEALQDLGAMDGCVLEKETSSPMTCLEVWFGDGQRVCREV